MQILENSEKNIENTPGILRATVISAHPKHADCSCASSSCSILHIEISVLPYWLKFETVIPVNLARIVDYAESDPEEYSLFSEIP